MGDVGREIDTGATKSALRNIKVHVVGVPVNKAAGGDKPGKSNAVSNDPFAALAGVGGVIEPPFDMFTLSSLGEYSATLQPVIDAYSINIDSFGHRFIPRFKTGKKEEIPKLIQKKATKESVRLQNFFEYATQESFEEFRMKLRQDLEYTGNAYFEVVRGPSGKVQRFVHLPSYQMRLTAIEDKQQLVSRKIMQLQDNGSVKVVKRNEYKRFRKFVQAHTTNRGVSGGVNTRWFKEFGDPRNYDNTNGEQTSRRLKPDKAANEVVHLKIYSPRSPYGLPRFVGNMLSIYGDRASEEINYITFKNNNIPSMVLLVSNGQLTQGSIERINTLVETQIQGSDNYSKFLILEAEGDMEGEDGSQVKLDIKPLVKEQHDDALFQNYSANNRERIRQAFRLPGIFIGSGDFNRATAETSRRLADEQIFAPERKRFDDLMNRTIFPEMGITYHQYKSNSPNTTDNTELVKILASSEKTGGMNPKIARSILEDVLNIELPEFSDDFNADIPFSLSMAEAVKNQADPTEPGQQVTALKHLEMVDKLLDLSEIIDDSWLTEVPSLERDDE